MDYLGERSVSSVLLRVVQVAWTVSKVAMVLLGVFILIGLIKPDWLNSVSAGTLSIEALSMQLEFTSAEYRQYLLPLLIRYMVAVIVPSLAVTMYVIYQLKSVLSALCSTNPFVAQNVTHIKKIGVATLIWAVYERLGYFVLGSYIAHRIVIPGVEIKPVLNLNVNMLFVGLVILVLAEVFKVGLQIRQDQELTI